MATLEEAYREALASAPVNQVIIHTIELMNPVFVNSDELQTPIRVVNDRFAFRGTLEAIANGQSTDAPFDPGLQVEFFPLSFSFSLPPKSDGEVPYMNIEIDNVSMYISDYIEKAAQTAVPLEMIYRPFLWYSDTDIGDGDGSTRVATTQPYPQMDPPIRMTISSIKMNKMRVTATARAEDFVNLGFPKNTYTTSRFPGLRR